MTEKLDELLKTDNSSEKAIADYLTNLVKNGNTVLGEKIENSGKKISECFEYITYKARENLGKKSNGVVMVDDNTVYGWATHYYDENGNPSDYKKPEPLKTTDSYVPRIIKTTPVIQKKEKKENEQISLFDL